VNSTYINMHGAAIKKQAYSYCLTYYVSFLQTDKHNIIAANFCAVTLFTYILYL